MSKIVMVPCLIMMHASESSTYDHSTGGYTYNTHLTMSTPSSYGGTVSVVSQKSQGASIGGSMMYDPLYDYLDFYNLCGPSKNFNRAACQFMLDDYQSKHKFWSTDEIIVWLEANVKDRVFVQKNSHSRSWIFQFVDFDERNAFSTWVNCQSRQHKFEIKCDKENRETVARELENWCKTNCKKLFDIIPSYNTATVRVDIQDTEEAVMFKLAFSERML